MIVEPALAAWLADRPGRGASAARIVDFARSWTARTPLKPLAESLAASLRSQGFAVVRGDERGGAPADVAIVPAGLLGDWAAGCCRCWWWMRRRRRRAHPAAGGGRGGRDERARRSGGDRRPATRPGASAAGAADRLCGPVGGSGRPPGRAGRPLPLHPREFALLGHLARHRDRPVERMALFQAVWQRRFDPGTNVVAVNMSRLRAKVDHGLARPLIHTVDGAYMLSDRLP